MPSLSHFASRNPRPKRRVLSLKSLSSLFLTICILYTILSREQHVSAQQDNNMPDTSSAAASATGDACLNVECRDDEVCVSRDVNGTVETRCVPSPSASGMTESTADMSSPRAAMASRPAPGGALHFSGGAAPAMGPRGGIMFARSSLGLTPGGAQDINNFRENIKNDYMPLPQSITYEGLYSDYYFDITGDQQCDEGQLFCPVFQTAVSSDPFAENRRETYLAVGLKSSLSLENWERPAVNLALVIDISGSMSAPMQDYYYDFVNATWVRSEDSFTSKMKVARESLANALKRLKPQDRVSVVAFDDTAEVIQSMQQVSAIDMSQLTKKVLALEPRGGTNLGAGYTTASNQFSSLQPSSETVENRIIVLTDMQPNLGVVGEESLPNLVKGAYESKEIGTTFFLVGLDANTELVELMSKVRGSNYFSVQNVPEFKDKLVRTFDYMVSPLMFDLGMKVSSNGYSVKYVYGSPNVNATQQNPDVLHIKTLFPSLTSERGVKGGIVLLLLEKLESCPESADCNRIDLTVQYETRDGRISTAKKEVQAFNQDEAEINESIRKAVLLTRYARALKLWLNTERKVRHPERTVLPRSVWTRGLPIDFPYSNRWELLSQKLTVSREMKDIFEKMKEYFTAQMEKINDDELDQEKDVLQKLLTAPETAEENTESTIRENTEGGRAPRIM